MNDMGKLLDEMTREGTLVRLTKQFLKVHGEEWEIECEVRQLAGPEFGGEA